MLEPDMPSMVAPPLLPAAAITPPPRVSTRFARKWLWAIAAVAVLFRLADASQPGFHHPDEIWQYVEPAYGWVTGHWIVPWEFHVGLRGWLIPALFAPIIALGQFVAPGTPFDQALLRCVLAVLALIVPATFWRIGRQVSTIHGLGAALMAAIWPEIFYFAGRPSGENLACILLFAAIWLLWRPMPGGHSRRDALLVGVCLALATIIRFQYLPAIGLLALRGIWPDPRRLIGPMVLGGLAGIAIGGLADLAAGQTPFLWIWTNFAMNLGQNRSAFFGTQPPWWFAEQILLTWSWGSLLIVPAVIVGARRFPLLAVLALVTILSHSMIEHKEYRFVLFAVFLLLLLGAVGMVDLLLALAARWPVLARPAIMMAVLAPLWLALGVQASVVRPFVDNWGKGRALTVAMAQAGADPGLCGIAIYRAQHNPTAAYSLLGRDTPMGLIDGPLAPQAMAANAMRFNYVFAARQSQAQLPANYELISCQLSHLPIERQQYCLFRRPGRCAGGAGDFDYNTVLTREGH